MCTNIVEQTPVTGAGKGEHGWFKVKTAMVSYDHPVQLADEHALNIDFLSDTVSERIAVEMDAASARALVATITEALRKAEEANAII
ncbi:MAG: hypothetical protein C4558_03235 [Dehalococcoidia bacterium]|nr:MAG: hypothetical protein C4558_03235 [Dehalococcoidia bacterium]